MCVHACVVALKVLAYVEACDTHNVYPFAFAWLCLPRAHSFWGAERKFWQVDGVYTTSVGYSGGKTANPKYYGVCSGRTGHAEVVNVVFDPKKVSYEKLLDVFWESHDPTTLNRQGNDRGTQYSEFQHFDNSIVVML